MTGGPSAPRRHVLFLNNSGYGHVLPTLDVVAELVRRGHEVTYVTGRNLVSRVADTGATVLGYDSKLVDVNLAEMVTPEATARMPGIYLQESVDIIRTVEEQLGDRRPDLVGYDLTVYHAGRILARKWRVPAAQSFPAFASNRHFSFLEKMMEKMGRGDPRHPELLAAVARLTRLLAEHGQAETDVEEFVGRIEELNLVFCPRSFHPAGSTFDERFVFMGPCLDGAAAQESWTPPASGRPVVLVSLGTSVHNRPGFFPMCLAAFRDEPWHVVMAVHRGVDPAELGPLPPNIEVHPWVPQLGVLRHAAAFVSHGGLGSVMGSMLMGTPVVLVPPSPEHKVNAQRVAELGLGRLIREEALTADRLRSAVRDVLADRLTQRRVDQMRADVVAAGGAPVAADAIERRMAAGRSRSVTPGLTGTLQGP